MDIEFTKQEYDAKLEYVIEEISRILCYTHISKHGKEFMLSYVPELKDVPTERWLCENVTIKNNEVCRMSLGVGYKYEGVLARREYCELKGIKYNFSEWEIFNKKQLDGKP